MSRPAPDAAKRQDPDTHQHPENLRAIALMVAAMAAFAMADLCIKLLAGGMNAAEILLGAGTMGMGVFWAMTRRAGLRVVSSAFLHPVVLLRNGVEMAGTACMISALTLAPLSLVSSITQAMPLVVTLGAALFLGERVGPRRWLAVVIGLFGVLLILRPGTAALSLGAVLALGAVFGLGARDVITRLIPAGISTLQLATYGFGVLIPTGAILTVFSGTTGPPTALEVALVAGVALFSALGYYAITAAMRIGEVSLVTPFRYTRLLFALAIGVLVLGERPDGMTLIGAGIVIGSGLYVLLRERQIARQRLLRADKRR